MSKQFITNLHSPFPEAFTELLYGWETQHNGCREGGRSSRSGGYKNQCTQGVVNPSFQFISSSGGHPHRSLSYGASMSSPNALIVTPTCSHSTCCILNPPLFLLQMITALLPSIRQSPPSELQTMLSSRGFAHARTQA